MKCPAIHTKRSRRASGRSDSVLSRSSPFPRCGPTLRTAFLFPAVLAALAVCLPAAALPLAAQTAQTGQAGQAVPANMAFTLSAPGNGMGLEILTPARLVELVQTSNPSVISARLGEKEATGRLESAKGARLPTVSVDSKASWIANPAEEVTLGAGSFGSLPVPSAANPTLLPSSDVTIADAQDPFYYQAAFSLDQAVWTWGKLDAAVNTREKERLAAQTNGDRTEASALAELQRSLYALSYQREALSIVEAQRDLSARMLTSVAASRDAGAVTNLEYEEAVLNAEQLERSAESLADSISKLERNILFLAGLEPSGAYIVTTDGIESGNEKTPVLEDAELWTDQARSDNLDLLYASRSVDLRNAAANLARRQAAGKPDVGLNLRGGWNGSRLPGESDWDDKGDWFVTATVAVKGNLLDFGTSSGKVHEAEAAAARSVSDFNRAASQVVTAVETSLSTLETLSRDVEYKERLALFRSAKVKDAESRREAGAGTELSVMNAQSDHLSAVLDLAAARMQYADARVSFLLLASPSELAGF